MPASTLSRLFDVVTSARGASLLAPAILLVGTTLAVGQGAPQAPAAPTEVAPAPAPKAAEAAAPAPGASNGFTPQQREELKQLVKDVLLANPEIMLEVQNALEARMDKIQAERMAVALKEHANELYRPTGSGIAGNLKGDLPLVEFFDYNCGYCKKAFTDAASFVEKDKNVRFILKEFPILSKGSEEAAKVALAAKMQGKYWEMHRALIESQGQANEASALRAAEKLGLDMARLKRDINSPEVKKEIDDTRALAAKMGIQGTPHFIVGDKIIPGAPENLVELLTKHAIEVRKDGCKVC
ncbi:MAG: DsbA family protein [Hyphomicrobiaceae bacterium]|nr:DsbA family protein [Hyphomicrobiaceae bacterium]